MGVIHEGMTMPHYETKRVIRATPDRIWPILTDPGRLADGSFSILELSGRIAEGETIRLKSSVDPKRVFAIKVEDVVPRERMTWWNGLPFGLFRGTRRFRLTPVEGGTEFHMREDYTGPLARMMYRVIPDLAPSFETFADGLARAAEGEPA